MKVFATSLRLAIDSGDGFQQVIIPLMLIGGPGILIAAARQIFRWVTRTDSRDREEKRAAQAECVKASKLPEDTEIRAVNLCRYDPQVAGEPEKALVMLEQAWAAERSDDVPSAGHPKHLYRRYMAAHLHDLGGQPGRADVLLSGLRAELLERVGATHQRVRQLDTFLAQRDGPV